MNISIIPVGYADGLNRKLSNGVGSVIINGKICSIIGKISMGNFAVNTTGVIVNEGDIVKVKVLDIDSRGKVKLSMKEAESE